MLFRIASIQDIVTTDPDAPCKNVLIGCKEVWVERTDESKRCRSKDIRKSKQLSSNVQSSSETLNAFEQYIQRVTADISDAPNPEETFSPNPEETFSAGEDSPTVDEDSSTVDEDSSTVDEDSSTVDEDSSTVNEDSSTVDDDSSTVDEDSSMVDENSSISDIDSSTADEEDIPSDEDTADTNTIDGTSDVESEDLSGGQSNSVDAN